MRFRHFIGVAVSAVLLVAGCGSNPVRARLADIETFAESNPDSARRALEAIDPSFLNTRKLRAQHALMLSSALDRCKIKAPNDSLIGIAVDYFSQFGPQKEKFLSYYYQGRVYENMGDVEAAMYSYVEAESIHSKSIPLKYLTSLQIKKGKIYRSHYDYPKAVEAFQKAQDYALQCDWRSNYYSALIGELITHVIFDSTEEAKRLIQVINPLRNEITRRNRMAFDSAVIMSLIQQESERDSILTKIRAFEQEYSSLNGFSLASLSFYYSKAGNVIEAERVLNEYAATHAGLDSDKQFLLASSVINDSLGVFSDAEKERSALYQILSNEVFEKNSKNPRFVEEKTIHEREKKKSKNEILLGSVFVILLSVLFFLLMSKRRKQKNELSLLYESLKEEYGEMSRLIQSNADIQDEAKSLLGERVRSLAQFLSVAPPSSLDKVTDELDSLTENRKELLETIGLLYAVYHPAFVNRLQDYGLSNGEIGYCCLLILGFRTGEIGDVINRSSTYHISSAIRQKVGLGPKDTNLSIFLKNMFKETEA